MIFQRNILNLGLNDKELILLAKNVKPVRELYFNNTDKLHIAKSVCQSTM